MGNKDNIISLEVDNLTNVIEFVLLGLQGSPQLRILLFCLLFIVFLVTACGNLLIITLVSTSKTLHTPMYFFISQLSITDIAPNLLYILLNNGGIITFIGCISQLYVFCTAEASECFLLTAMSYDRYVAICHPLHYISIMTSTFCVKLAFFLWSLNILNSLIYVLRISKLQFCGSNIIDHLFCDLIPLLELACSDSFPLRLQMYLLSVPFLIIPNLIIVISYVNIVRTVLQIPSRINREKAFSTCSSHLTVVFIFYLSMFSVYILPTNGQMSDVVKIASLLYTVFTPMVNPIIYSFRNKDIKKAIQGAI